MCALLTVAVDVVADELAQRIALRAGLIAALRYGIIGFNLTEIQSVDADP